MGQSRSVRILLVSTYDLGHQPFGLASPAAWLRADGHSVTCADLSREPAPREAVRSAELIAFFLPMHTATRLAVKAIRAARSLNPEAHLCGYGLYAPVNEELLRGLGVRTILGGEFEQGLRDVAAGKKSEARISLERQHFLTPDRSGLPPLSRYAQLMNGGAPHRAGYTEASRGCKHLCRHCPIVPVYHGIFRIVQRETVLADVRQQVMAGAEHITFGDPDFFNGTGHAIPLVEALDAEFPGLTYDVTIKVEHLLRHRDLLPILRRTGCLFVTSAVESADDLVLEKLAKGHTRRDFLEAVRLTRDAGLCLAPTFMPFTPWTTRESLRDLLRLIVELELVEQVAPIQLAIRLLIPAGSRLLELEDIRGWIGPFDVTALVYPWQHTDPDLDRLCGSIQSLIHQEEHRKASRSEIFQRIWRLVHQQELPLLPARATIPYLTEPWYC